MPRFLLHAPSNVGPISANNVRSVVASAKRCIAAGMSTSALTVNPGDVDVLVQTYDSDRSDVAAFFFGTVEAYDLPERLEDIDQRMLNIGHGILSDNEWLKELASTSDKKALDLNFQGMVAEGWVSVKPPQPVAV